ncbi:hypothetical protein [Klebsiella phage DP]|nr:hypothetical protein [Klebsiella phage DP]
MTAKYETVPYADFVKALKAQFAVMQALGALYTVDVPKDELYDLYLDSFPEGTNLMYKERREYDCNCCKSYIRTLGRVVAIHNGKLVSIWDVKVGGYYQVVADAMKARVESSEIRDRFFHFEGRVGTESNVALLENGKTKTWTHFHQALPRELVKRGEDIPSALGEYRDNATVLARSLKDIDMDSAETVMDLINQGSLYRGDEKKHIVAAFIKAKRAYDKTPEDQRMNFCWKQSETLGRLGRFRNDVIGTLMSDLAEGVDLEAAVKSFEDKVSGTNYKRTTALVTPGMIKAAQEKVEALGLTESLARRFAVTSDLTINNVLFADRSAKAQMNVFEQLAASTKNAPKSLSKVEEISIEDFINNVLPKADTIEALVEGRLTPNLMSLVAPANAGAPNLFKWDNGFSWSYNGEVADSIKERVKTAGGNVDGFLRVSLAWHNADDLDLHMRTPRGHHVYFGNKRGAGAYLDLDMNGMDKHDYENPVENIIFTNENNTEEGIYRVWVNQWSRRSGDRVGFTVQLDHKGQQYDFNHPREHRSGDVQVVTFRYTRKGGVEIIESMPHTKQSKEVWGVSTETFQKVSLVLNSPNFWDGQTKGNKHYFFMLEGCINPDDTRGFYNEYLRDELHEHRKVFEVLGSKLKAEHSTDQLSGLGFSSTQRNELVVKVTGSFNRTLKIKF